MVDMFVHEWLFVFLHEWLFVVGVIMVFGACGFGILAPFAEPSRYWFFGAPFAGLIIVPLGANTFYSLFVLSYQASASLAALCCVLLSLAVGLFYRARMSDGFAWSTLAALGLVGAVVAAAAVLLFEGATLYAGGPAIQTPSGTDHFGYSHLADWLNSRPVTVQPHWLPGPEQPYDGWPAVMFSIDPRFGSFGFLAIVSSLYGTSGMFTYDVASAIAVAAAILALAALFARSIAVFSLIAAGLLLCHWIDYAHIGFFGKVLGYPAAIFVAGLALGSLRSASLDRIVALIILTAAAAILHSGPATALLAGVVLVPALVALAMQGERKYLFDAVLMCGVVILVPVIASGTQARPIYFSFPDWSLEWSYVFPRILDLESQIGSVSGLGPAALQGMLAIAGLTWVGLLALAFRQRSLPAIGLLAGPALLLIVLFVLGGRAHAFQLIGYFYPALVCGAGCLAVGIWPWKQTALALLALAIAERGPRLVGAVRQFVTSPSQPFLLSKLEFDQMTAIIGPSGVVQVDIDNPQRAIAILVEFGRRGLNVQWTARAWKTILGYRPWPAPTYPVRPAFALIDPSDIARPGTVLHASARYRLVRLD
jgi:hypothetical protein